MMEIAQFRHLEGKIISLLKRMGSLKEEKNALEKVNLDLKKKVESLTEKLKAGTSVLKENENLHNEIKRMMSERGKIGGRVEKLLEKVEVIEREL